MKVAVIGCGFAGQKRASALGNHELVCVCDTDMAASQALAAVYPNATVVTDWHQVAEDKLVEVVIVSTTHNMLAEIATKCLYKGKHVLIEKPGARQEAELEKVRLASQTSGGKVRVGFNHRFHPAIRKAHDLAFQGEIGNLMFVRARYGHGGRPGYHQEWRANRDIAGGGELIDQGSHLIDLSQWFLGDFVDVRGTLATYFWDMPVEDNAFLLLRTSNKQIAWLHASWTEWKNTFSLEIYGQTGKLHIEGLGGSYGVERLTLYKMGLKMGPPETISWEFPGEDLSWAAELAEFELDILNDRACVPGLKEAGKVLSIIETVYKEAENCDYCQKPS